MKTNQYEVRNTMLNNCYLRISHTPINKISECIYTMMLYRRQNTTQHNAQSVSTEMQ